ncbi:hypothetical protein DICSQDRAFT_169265 [Dichomitus squalens LYAD-421 SS1]|uniref:Uncharacterized protein n=2 Tax=Dichomitus squalens TaxID=114155 RepID=A0A4Q9MM87_9APHY|nr:uncharacterized protein DICSQDRAFT_169265 [Dichomitus squalens LYAD-421 SS1]EJF62233.1 hypothetical protein DICSQDRAFT_169265 [Dichomitus squalens LYAD-421 SS1]TBU28760.1 hypothetical protein BD311DRAFT_806790 [Dichomitus squalens]
MKNLTAQSAADVLSSLPTPAIDKTYGALLIATYLGFIVYGLSLYQLYRYFQLYPTDTRLIKTIVLVLFALDTFHILCCVVGCYWHLVTNYFNPSSLDDNHWSIQLLPPTGVVIILICQAFYARRVYLLESRYRWVVSIAAVSMISLLGFCTASTVESFLAPNVVAFRKKNWLFAAMYGSATATDVVLTSSLVLALWRSRTGLKRVNTSLGFLFTVILPGNLIFNSVASLSVKVYVVSMLST